MSDVDLAGFFDGLEETWRPVLEGCERDLIAHHRRFCRRMKTVEPEEFSEALRRIVNRTVDAHAAVQSLRWELIYAQAQHGNIDPVGPIVGKADAA